MGSALRFSEIAPNECLRECDEAINEEHSDLRKVICSVGGGLLWCLVKLFVLQDERRKSLVLETESVSVEEAAPPWQPK